MVYKKSAPAHPNEIMDSAIALQRVVLNFEETHGGNFDKDLFLGQFIAEPVLLALSMELALKAWWSRSNPNLAPLRTHDLLKIFEKLPIQTQLHLEYAHP